MLFVIVLFASIAMATPAHATSCDLPLHGTYTALSDGQWAQTRDSYHDEATVTATWTVSTTCSSFQDCTGQVTSDQGWSAAAYCESGLWHVSHDVPNWEPCADGTAATGHQTFIFSSISDPNRFEGLDKTVGPSGACGINQWQTVRMPFTLTKIE
jgi:hypothetical protein